MSYVDQTINLKDGNVLEISSDDCATSPREDCNLGVMAAFHNRHNLGDDNLSFNTEDFNGWSEMEKHIMNKLNAIVCLPLYLYDHSGITINTTGFSCNFDSGQVGFIYITNKEIDELGCTLNNGESWTDYIDRLKTSLISEVKIYDQYITGDIFSFEIKTPGGEHVDSCAGFYGSDLKTNGMLEHISDDLINLDDL